MKHRITSLLTLTLASLLAIPPASAQLTRELSYGGQYHPTYPSNAIFLNNRGPDGPRFFTAAALGGRCTTYANYGVIRVFADHDWPGRSSTDVYNTRANGSFRDVVTINHPTLNGVRARITIAYRVDGVVVSTGQVEGNRRNYAEIRSTATVASGGEESRWRKWPDGEVEFGAAGDVYNQTRTVTGEFFFGEPFYVGLSIGAHAGASGTVTSYMKVDAEHTATWHGINSVNDLNGNPITGYTVTSASGTDYTQPVSGALRATGAVSRKTHDTAGNFDIPLPGVEPRTGGANRDFTLVTTFNNQLASGSASVASGTATIAGSPVISGNTMLVNLTGVNNAQNVTVNLTNVTDSFGQVLPQTPVTASFLLGDVNGSSSVTASDIGAVKGAAGQAVTSANFRADVIPTGSITASDIGQVKVQSGTSVSASDGSVTRLTSAS